MAPKPGLMQMKNFLKKLAKVLLILFLVLLGVVVAALVIGNLANRNKGGVETISGQSTGISEAMAEAWKKTPSDIEGMSKWDKYEAGLAVISGSDTDGDGLTDKEEIEIHHTDPLKVSSSGDLYSDLYKVQNGMDPSVAYTYQGDQTFAHNSCPEVHLSAQIPTDFNAVVTACAGVEQVSGLKVYAAYEVYNYSGKFSVDLAALLKKENIKLSDIGVYVSNGNELKNYSFTKQDGTITLRKAFSPKSTYKVYIAEKNFIRFAAARLGASDALDLFDIPTEGKPEEEITGSGLVIVSPLLTELLNQPITIYYEKLDTEEKTQAMKNKVVDHFCDFMGIENEYPITFKETSALEIEFTYNTLQSVADFLDVTNMSHSDIGWKYIFFMYYSYEGKLDYEQQIESEESWNPEDPDEDPDDSEGSVNADPMTGFNPMRDTLPFGNFKTAYSPNGSCAGISHLTAYLFNRKSFPNGSGASIWDSEYSWDLTGDSENATLLNSGLGDYKTESFVRDHSMDGQTLSVDLTPGEEEFVKMIASSYLAGNENAEFICGELLGGDLNTVVQDYSVIESAIAYLRSGKILDVYLDMVDGTRHTVNIYGYRRESETVTWFSVYDCNFPRNQTDGQALSESGFALRVEKKLRASGSGWTFSFDYFPLEDKTYGASSNPDISDHNLILILDEFGRLLND